MPELPEVEVCRQGLLPCIAHARIEQVVVRTPRLRLPIAENLPQRLVGCVLEHIERRGKYLLFKCAKKNENGWLIVHLGMSGSLRIAAKNEAPQKHDHVDFIFRSGKIERILRFRDPRRFGLILWHEGDDILHNAWLARLGIEPLTDVFTSDWLFANTRRRATAIKLLLMDSHFIVGVGNIYASEALFRAGLSPLAPARNLTNEQCARICAAVRETLADAISAGGSSIRDYVKSDGSAGNFQLDYAVYARTGEACPRCQTAIEQIRQGGRSTFFCPKCQSE